MSLRFRIELFSNSTSGKISAGSCNLAVDNLSRAVKELGDPVVCLNWLGNNG